MTNKMLVRIRVWIRAWIRAWIKIYIKTRNYYQKFIQISAVAKVIAKEALAQPISAWPCIWDLNFPPKKRVPFFFSEKIL